MLPAELPTLLGGRYRVVRELGRGGMGVVFEVEHVHTGARLALKLLVAQSNASGQTVERFKREARASAQISSEHVVRVTDADVAPELGNAPFVVMELLVGADLEGVAGLEPQPPARVVGWLRQVARGLDKAHRLGVIHRDLKPANVFVTSHEDGTPLVKILDFGIAKLLDGAAGTTTTGEVLGTPLYMAPEQARGKEALTGAVDRYALGLIAYRLLCGKVYWRTTGIAHVINEVLYLPYDAPSSRESTYGPPFDAWFARAVALDPTKRFASAVEQIEELAAALDVPPLPANERVAMQDREGIAAPTPSTPKDVARASFELGPTVPISATLSGARRDSSIRGGRGARAGAIGFGAAALVVLALLFAARAKRETAAQGSIEASPESVVSVSATPAAARAPEMAASAPPVAVSASSAASGDAPRPGGARDAGHPAPPKPTGARPPPPAAAPSPSKSAPTLDPFGDQK